MTLMIENTEMVHDFTLASARGNGTPRYDSISTIQPAGTAGESRLECPVVSLTGSYRTWTDCLSPELSHLGLIFSERVMEALIMDGLTGLKWSAVDFDFSGAKGAAKPPGQAYYMVRVSGAAPVLSYRIFEKVEGKYQFRFETRDKNTDPRCKVFFTREGFIPHTQTIRIEGSGEGDDFMPVPDQKPALLPFGSFYCSRRFVELAKQHDFSNFAFTPIDRISPMARDFRTYDWPPENWYPAAQPSGPH